MRSGYRCRRGTRGAVARESHRAPYRGGIHRRNARVRARLSVPARLGRGVARAAPRDAAHARSGRFGRDRRRADGHLSARIAGWLASDGAHAIQVVRSRPRTAVPAGAGRSRALLRDRSGRIRAAGGLERMTIEVVKSGLLTTLQDAGRSGYAHLGIGRSGAFDAPALRIANALCGNPPDACGLEITLLGPTLRFDAGTWIAVTGAPIAFHIEGTERPMWSPAFVPAGATVTFGGIRSGCRSYLGVAGGFNAEPVLGSRSIDVNASLGPNEGRPLRAGDALETGSSVPASSGMRQSLHQGAHDPVPKWRLDPKPWFSDDSSQPLRLLP